MKVTKNERQVRSEVKIIMINFKKIYKRCRCFRINTRILYIFHMKLLDLYLVWIFFNTSYYLSHILFHFFLNFP